MVFRFLTFFPFYLHFHIDALLYPAQNHSNMKDHTYLIFDGRPVSFIDPVIMDKIIAETRADLVT